MNDLRAQLAPGWSGVNIAIAVVLSLFALPLGLLMIAYIVWGRQLGLDFSKPETVKTFGGRIAQSWRAGVDSWRQGPSLSRGTGASSAGTPDWSGSDSRATGDTSASDETLRREREMLTREREAFEGEKREWEDSARARRGEPLDS